MKKRMCGKSISSVPCTSKFNRLLNMNASTLKLDFSLLEEDEILEFVEMITHESPTQASARSTRRLELDHSFSLSPSDLRVPVRQYLQLCQYVMDVAPSMLQLTISLDALYKEKNKDARNLSTNIGNICSKIAQLVQQLSSAIAQDRKRQRDCDVSFTLRNAFIQGAVQVSDHLSIPAAIL